MSIEGVTILHLKAHLGTLKSDIAAMRSTLDRWEAWIESTLASLPEVRLIDEIPGTDLDDRSIPRLWPEDLLAGGEADARAALRKATTPTAGEG